MVVKRNQSPIRTLITSTAPVWANGPRLGKRLLAGQTAAGWANGRCLQKQPLLGKAAAACKNGPCLGIPVIGLLYGRFGAGYDSANDGRMWTMDAPETL